VTAPVTIVSCVYGSSHDRFVDEWAEAVSHLEPAPADVIVATDRDRHIPGASVMYSRCPWDHPQAFYLQMAAMVSGTDWVWIVDIDDLAFTDGLAGLDEVEEDVWQLGYLSSEGHQHLPPQMTAADYLNLNGNPFSGASMFRTAIFDLCGGFTDVAFQDWSLWRRMARMGATFKASDRPHFEYRRHSDTRTAVELIPDNRTLNLLEMMRAEVGFAS
jgi:hypothetical protein